MSPDEEGQALVWRLGDALLAAPLEAVVEVTIVGADGRAVTRAGPVDLTAPPGARSSSVPQRAVVVRARGDTLALAADEVEGVVPRTLRDSAVTPSWLRSLPTTHISGLVRLDGGRVAALLAIDTLHGP